jgi:cell division protein FtsQ
MKIKKEIKIAFTWVIIFTYIFVALSFVKTQKNYIQCLNIDIVVVDSTENYFVEGNDIKKVLKKSDFEILGYPIYNINTLEIENRLKELSSVKNVKTYCNYRGKMSIEIEQRKPILRIINYNGESYYIDDKGAMMHLSSKYTAKVLVANGNINEPFESRYSVNVKKAQEDEFGRGKILSDLYDLAKFIQNNEFWKAEIEQIYVDENNEIYLIPVVGIHKILIGKIENYKIKLRNLKQFYKTGITKTGWNTYSLINLKYENQIVCTKK